MLIIFALSLYYYFDVNQYLNIDVFQYYKTLVIAFANQHYLLSVLCYIGTYLLLAAFLIPGSASITLIGGFLFNTLPGFIYTIIGAIAGSIIAFLSVRFIIGSILQKHFKDKLKNFNQKIEKFGIYYLLTLRVIPIMPFFLVNILAGLTTISIFTFSWTTALGIMPATLIYSFLGEQLKHVNKLQDIFSPLIILALILLSSLSLMPLFLRFIIPRFIKE